MSAASYMYVRALLRMGMCGMLHSFIIYFGCPCRYQTLIYDISRLTSSFAFDPPSVQATPLSETWKDTKASLLLLRIRTTELNISWILDDAPWPHHVHSAEAAADQHHLVDCLAHARVLPAPLLGIFKSVQ